MREYCTSGSVRGAARKGSSYRGGITVGITVSQHEKIEGARADRWNDQLIRQLLVFCLAAILCGAAPSLFAEQPQRVPLIVSLALGATNPSDPIYAEIRRGLRDLGWAEGRDFKIEYRTAAGRMDRLPTIAAELVRLKPDVIVTGNDQTTRAARDATNTIPIVALLYNHDPVASGFIKSFNRPGGNITGMTVRDSQLAGKRLELLREIMPGLSRLAVFWDLPAQDELQELKSSAQALGIQLRLFKVKRGESIEGMFKAAKAQKVGALMVLHAPEFYVNRTQIGALAVASSLPAASSFREITEAGGLMSYSTDVQAEYYRGAYFIDRILKGVRPGDLPFEETSEIRLVLNQRAAEQLHVTIPQSILLRADEVIK